MIRWLIGIVCLGAMCLAAPIARSMLDRVDRTFEHLCAANKQLLTFFAKRQRHHGRRALFDPGQAGIPRVRLLLLRHTVCELFN